MHLLQDLISGIRTRRKEGGIDEKATTDIEVDALGTGRRVVEENQVIIQRLAKVGYLQQVNRFSDGLLMYSNPSFDLGIRYERTIDVAAESERLTKDIAKYEKGLASAERQLGNEGFLAKAPAHIVEGLKKQESETRLLLEKARAALNALPPA
jgi:valyl-tRNA synthetase